MNGTFLAGSSATSLAGSSVAFCASVGDESTAVGDFGGESALVAWGEEAVMLLCSVLLLSSFRADGVLPLSTAAWELKHQASLILASTHEQLPIEHV